MANRDISKLLNRNRFVTILASYRISHNQKGDDKAITKDRPLNSVYQNNKQSIIHAHTPTQTRTHTHSHTLTHTHTHTKEFE